MRLATVAVDGRDRVAVADGADLLLFPPDLSMLDVIQRGGDAFSHEFCSAERVPTDSVSFRAPLPDPRRNLICTGWNYLAHFEEGRARREPERELPEVPTFFTKATGTVIGPYDPIPSHGDHTTKLDWEAELAVVIGKVGRDIPEAEALRYVFGCTVANDISARDLQRGHGGQWFKGKSLDGTCPMGPWLVTMDELPDPQDLRISCTVNGEVMQEASTRQMIFSVARLVAAASQGMTLLPGDILLTGTPEGVGNAQDPPRYLRVDDEVVTEVVGIGSIRNRVRPG